MSKKLSRRDFARTSVAVAGAAAVTVPTALLGKEFAPETPSAAAGAAVAKRVRAVMPPPVGYGGLTVDGRDMTLADTLTPATQAAPSYPNGWREGTTIPGEYYVDEKHYPHDEQYIKDHFWLMVDHVARIPKPGDYFLFQYGRGDSVIIVRDQDNQVKGFHNVCRHRGSRLCISNEMLPTEAREDGKAPDPKFSVTQLGQQGNTPVFRCPYHAWTYDTSGKLISLPPGIPAGFDQSQHGLHPINLKVLEGFIFVTFSEDPPDFNTWVGNLPARMKEYHTAELKYAARRSVPNKANWKLVIENFRECYHCGPAHKNSYVTAHWFGDGTLTTAERARIEAEIAKHGHPEYQPEGDSYFQQNQIRRDRLIDNGTMATGMSAPRRRHFRPGYVTATVDGKPAAPFLPGFNAYNHGMGTGRNISSGASGFSTSAFFFYEDHVAACRFTPRAVDLTDAELFYLVHPDAKEGKDYNVEHLVALWHNTLREDRWVGENNHHGILSSRYAYKGGQPYMAVEGGPAGFVKWYMSEVVPHESTKQTSAG